MATTSDALELKVSSELYMSRMSELDAKLNKLTTILEDYRTLKTDATRVFGEDDENLGEIQRSVEANINAVQGQINMLNAAKEMLRKQEEELGLLNTNIGNVVKEGVESAQSAFKAIKAVGEVAALIG